MQANFVYSFKNIYYDNISYMHVCEDTIAFLSNLGSLYDA